jgi:hypothetical protein
MAISAYKRDSLGYYVEADPASDLDYALVCWQDGQTFSAVAWSIALGGAVLHDPAVNSSPVTIDGVTYAVGMVATVWVKQMSVGQIYTVTCNATFSGGGRDERSFRIVCKER